MLHLKTYPSRKHIGQTHKEMAKFFVSNRASTFPKMHLNF